jgi:hypothetical protein
VVLFDCMLYTSLPVMVHGYMLFLLPLIYDADGIEKNKLSLIHS